MIDAYFRFTSVWADGKWIVKGTDIRMYSMKKRRWEISDRNVDPLPFAPHLAFWTGAEVLLFDPLENASYIFVP